MYISTSHVLRNFGVLNIMDMSKLVGNPSYFLRYVYFCLSILKLQISHTFFSIQKIDFE